MSEEIKIADNEFVNTHREAVSKYIESVCPKKERVSMSYAMYPNRPQRFMVSAYDDMFDEDRVKQALHK